MRKKSNFQYSFNGLNNWFQSMVGNKKEFMDPIPNTQQPCDTSLTPTDIDFDLLQEVQSNQPYVEHTLSLEQLNDLYPLSRIKSLASSSYGLNQDEAEIALKDHGPNIIKPKKRRKRERLRFFFKQFLNKFRILLLIVAIACLTIFLLDQTRTKELTMSVILFVIFFTLSVAGFVEQAKIVNQISGHQKMVLGDECSVIRGSKEVKIPSNLLVRGDLLRIKTLDKIAADCRLIYTKDLKIETSCISGETDCINYTAETAQKSTGVFDANNLVFGGSTCRGGEGLGLVIRTGNSTLIGQLSQVSSREKHKSRLELEYTSFSWSITIITLCMATVTFLVGLILSGFANFNNVLINGFFVVIIANIPQGLPVTLSAQLIILARKLAKMGIFIKRTDIADTLGLTSVLLIDKSTLLAPNQMQLTRLWINRTMHSIDGTFSMSKNNNSQTLNEILDVISVCNQTESTLDSNTSFEHSLLGSIFSSKSGKSGKYQFLAHKTSDSVLADFVQQSGHSIDERNSKFELVFELPSTSNRRFHLSVVKQKPLDEIDEDIYTAVLKGTPEELIQNCSSLRTDNNETELINTELLSEFEQSYEQLAVEGNTCIGFASMQLNYNVNEKSMETICESLLDSQKWCFLGMTAIAEPISTGVEAAVKRADQARIRLFLLTNDHPTNAETLARQIGFYNQNISISTTSFCSMESLNTSSTSYEHSEKSSGSLSMPIVLHGNNLDAMSEQEWTAVLKHRHIIFSRITACQKMELICHCRRMSYVVALTGNELMDAKSLKEADIGIATRINGSIFAKEAADIFATQSDLPNIVEGIAQTRLLFDNFRKTLAYNLSHLLPEILPVLLSFILGLPLALNSVQVLTIDLMTELAPSIALIFEPPESNIMKRPPRRPSARLVTPALLCYSYCIAGTLISAGCIIAYFSVFWFYELASSDLLFTANHHWTHNATMLRSSRTGITFDGVDQTQIYQQASAAWCICLEFSQIFNLLSCMTRRSSIFKHGIRNPALIVAIIIKLFILLLIMFVPAFQSIVGVQPPPLFVWFIPIGVGLILLLVNEIRKFFIRRKANNLLVRMVKW